MLRGRCNSTVGLSGATRASCLLPHMTWALTGGLMDRVRVTFSDSGFASRSSDCRSSSAFALSTIGAAATAALGAGEAGAALLDGIVIVTVAGGATRSTGAWRQLAARTSPKQVRKNTRALMVPCPLHWVRRGRHRPPCSRDHSAPWAGYCWHT